MNQQILEALSIFVFMYPAGMAIYWVCASFTYYIFIEGKLNKYKLTKTQKNQHRWSALWCLAITKEIT